MDKIIKEIKRQKPKLTIKNYMIKNNLYVFVNCLISNPAFDS